MNLRTSAIGDKKGDHIPDMELRGNKKRYLVEEVESRFVELAMELDLKCPCHA